MRRVLICTVFASVVALLIGSAASASPLEPDPRFGNDWSFGLIATGRRTTPPLTLAVPTPTSLAQRPEPVAGNERSPCRKGQDAAPC